MDTYVGNRPDKKGFGSFIRYNLFVILAFAVPAFIITVVFALKGFYPFGSRMILVNDGWHQYYPFLAEYQQMLKEGTSITYSWNTGGGVNFLGVLANYAASPLYLLAGLLPSGTPWLPVFLAFTVVVRIGCAGMFFSIFLRKVFRRNDISLVTFSLMYALCAYVLGYYWNTMWLDTVALLPLVIAGVVGVLRDKKFSLYIISLAVSVICSFYIGYMVCLFVLLFSICYTAVSFVSIRESLVNAGKMVIYSGIAFMIAGAVVIPAFMSVNQSDSASKLSELPAGFVINPGYGYDTSNIFNAFLATIRTATNMLSLANPIKMDKGLPNIACGMLTLVLIPFYFVTKKIKLREKLVSLGLLLFFLASFVLHQLNYVWHAMAAPAMVYYRWSFIFSFAVIVMAYRAYTLLSCFGKKTIMVSSILLAVYFAVSFFFHGERAVLATFAGSVVLVLGIVLYHMNKLTYKTLSWALCLFAAVNMGLNTYLGVSFVKSTSINNYPMDSTSVNKLVDYTRRVNGGDIFRTEFLQSQTLNDGALNSVFGITTFNSMVDSSYADTLKELGLAASKGNNRYEYAETNPVTNLFLNIRYLIGRDGQTACDTQNLEKIASEGDCTLYENKAYVPMGFMTDKAILSYAPETNWRFPAEVLNHLFSTATAIDEDVFIEVEPLMGIQSDKYSDKLIRRHDNPHSYAMKLASVTGKDGEDAPLMWVEYEIEEDGTYYGLFRSSADKKTMVIINDDRDNGREINENFSSFVSVGVLKKGDKIRVEMESKFSKDSMINYRLARLDEDVLDRGVEKLRENSMVTTQWTDTGVKGTIDVNESGLFYTSILYCDGWKAYVDGDEVEITPVADTFIAFELSEGHHKIELEFKAQGVGAGIIVSCVGIISFVTLCIVTLMLRKKAVRKSAGSKKLSEKNMEETSPTEQNEASSED